MCLCKVKNEFYFVQIMSEILACEASFELIRKFNTEFYKVYKIEEMTDDDKHKISIVIDYLANSFPDLESVIKSFDSFRVQSQILIMRDEEDNIVSFDIYSDGQSMSVV